MEESTLTPQDRAAIRESQEHFAKQAPTMLLEDMVHRAKLYLKVYPGTEQVELQIEVLEAEIGTRQAKYIAWLETTPTIGE